MIKKYYHGIKITNSNQEFHFGYIKLLHFLEQIVFPINQLFPGVKINRRKFMFSINKIDRTLKNLLLISRLLILSISELEAFEKETLLRDQFKPEEYRDPDNVDFYIELFYSRLRILMDDITAAMGFIYSLQNITGFKWSKFAVLCKKENIEVVDSFDPSLAKILKQIDFKSGWSYKITTIRDNFTHGNCTIQSIFSDGKYQPRLIDENKSISQDLIGDAVIPVKEFFLFLDSVFEHFYDQFAPFFDKDEFSEYCKKRPLITFSLNTSEFKLIFPQIQ